LWALLGAKDFILRYSGQAGEFLFMDHRLLRIALADGDHLARASTHVLLLQCGHDIVIESSTADDLVCKCNEGCADLVIADVNTADGNGLRKIESVHLPVVVTSQSGSDDAINRANYCGPLAHLVKPIRIQDLRVAIALTMQRHDELRAIHQEASCARQALEDRKVIERAKGIIMRQRDVDESGAFHHIQKLARNHRQPLVEVARSILLLE
jgi:AmiR/NasT family two-component response regulator